MLPRREACRSPPSLYRRAVIHCPATSSAAFVTRRRGRRTPVPPRTADGRAVRLRPRPPLQRIARLARYPRATVDRYSRGAPPLVDGVGEPSYLQQRVARLGEPGPELMPGVRNF